MPQHVIRTICKATLLTATLLAIGCSDSTQNSTAATRTNADEQQRLHHAGRWITDDQGRVVILHGVNMMNKFAPYHPAALGFDDDDIAKIAAEGFNTIRLGFIWKGLEPQPGQYDMQYLAALHETARKAGEAGLWVLMDFHQDMWNEKFNGEGAPDWASIDDGLPAQPNIGFPLNYFVMPALWRAYDHFFGFDHGPDGRVLADALADAWRVVAQEFRTLPRLVGYDLFNEPFPGSTYPLCANPVGCPTEDAKLTEVNRRLAQVVRKADPATMVFYEPFVTFDFGAATFHGDLGDDLAQGFTFHNYCLAAQPGLPPPPSELTAICGPTGEQMVFNNAEAQSRKTGNALLLSEFGATDDLTSIERMVNLADSNLVSWQYWAWWNRDPSAPRDSEGIIRDISKAPTADNLKQDKLDVLVRPYPQLVSGTPISFNFDRASRTFNLTYNAAKADGSGQFPAGSITRIWVPKRQYPNGYQVKIIGGRVLSNKGAEALEIQSNSGKGDIVITVGSAR